MAEALYRKYRPQVFEDVVGQEPIERTLKNAISQDKVSHAYLFCGPRGTGKTTTARLLAKALICEKGPTPDPDGTCEDCRLIAEGVHPDVYELDAASRTGVENVREEIISRVHFAPTRGRYKVYIVDEVHMLSIAAFNALLKTLEEPPSHVVFVLCTTDPQKVPDTIHSRCQRFDFHRISPESMVARLGAICVAEGVDFEGEALDLIAQRAEGGLRNALTSLEQIIAFENGEVTLKGAERLLGSIDSNDMAEIMAYVGKRDIANCFRWIASYVETGADLAQFVRDMSEHVRNLYVLALVGDDADLDVSETARRELASELTWFGPERLARLLGVLGDLSAELKTSSNPRLAFEIALTRMVRPDSDLTLESLAERVEALESGYSAVAHVLPGDPYATRSEGGGATQAEVPVSVPATAAAPAAAVPADAMQTAAYAPAAAERQPELESQAGVAVEPEARFSTEGSAVRRGAQDGAVPQQVVEGNRAPHEGPDPVVGHDGPRETAVSPKEAQGLAVQQETPSADRRPAAVEHAGQPQPAQPVLSNPAALQRIWQAALSDVRKRKQAHGVLFMSAKASYDEAKGMVRIAFPDESSFAFNAVQRADVQTALEEALAKAAGSPVAFYFEKGTTQVLGQSGAGAAGVASASATVGLAGDTAVAQPAAAQAQPAAAQAQAREFTLPPSGDEAAREHVSPVQTPPEEAASRQVARGQAPAEQVPYEQVPYDDVPYEQVPYDEMPYEQVPYEGMAYEQVPYDEFQTPAVTEAAGAGQQAPSGGSLAPGGFGQAGDMPFDGSSQAQPATLQAAAADVDTSPSPAYGALTPDGAVQDDPAALQAMLQASFGDGVVFSEADDEA